MKQKIITGLFLTSLLIYFSCGPNNNHNSDNGSHTTGTYKPALIFPADIPREESDDKEITGINCEAAQISTLEFSFTVNDSLHGPYSYACEEHETNIEGIPAGTGILVDVYAYDSNHATVLYGFEITDIHAGQVTEGSNIEMNPVDDSFTIDELGMTFVRIPAGTFIMGSPETELGRSDDEIRHEVTLTKDFFMQTTEVTQGQWQAVMGQNPSRYQLCGINCPVNRVSWDDVQAFLNRLNAQIDNGNEYRLPTEAQWEYAARAGSDTAFYGEDITEPEENNPTLETLGWYRGNSYVLHDDCDIRRETVCITPHPVGGKVPNAYGLYDMHGNVWEWCQDWHGDYPVGIVTDPVGPSSGIRRILRGGAFNINAEGCRSANRGWNVPGNLNGAYGFRLVAVLISR